MGKDCESVGRDSRLTAPTHHTGKRMDDLKSWKELARANRGITRKLAEFVSGLQAESIPAHTEAVLAKAVVDAIGCGLYGLTMPWARILQEFAAEQGGPPEGGWAQGQRGQQRVVLRHRDTQF